MVGARNSTQPTITIRIVASQRSGTGGVNAARRLFASARSMHRKVP